MRWLRGEKMEIDDRLAPLIAEFQATSPEFRQLAETFLDSSVSHYVFDGGNLVAAHAGMKECLQGRGSSAVRAFALHGESPGENESEAAAEPPAWVLEYQGAARVIYSHPGVSEPLWLNQTVNIGTAALPGGCLTAFRFPELQVESVPLAEPSRLAAAL